jgi:hypothetical protein
MPTEHLQAPVTQEVAQGRILAPFSAAPMLPMADATLIAEDTYGRVAPVVAQKLEQSAAVRAMLDAFRRDGCAPWSPPTGKPEEKSQAKGTRSIRVRTRRAASRFNDATWSAHRHDPECNALVDQLRGAQPTIVAAPPRAPRDVPIESDPFAGFPEQRTTPWPHQRRPRVLLACTGSVAVRRTSGAVFATARRRCTSPL